MPRNGNTPTRKDVADLAGVSETIVSYVLNANRYVSADKKKGCWRRLKSCITGPIPLPAP
jgi:hypothetical protein